MNDAKQEKIRRFANDELMSEAVFELLRASFLRTSPNKEVNYLAAKWLSIESLNEAWKELGEYREKRKVELGRSGNVGV